MLKSFTFPPRGHVLECSGLAPSRLCASSSFPDELSPIRLRTLLDGRHKPLGEFMGRIIAVSGSDLVAISPGTTETAAIASLPDGCTVLSAMPAGDGSHFIVTTSGPYLLISASEGGASPFSCREISDTDSSMPRFTVGSAVSLSASVPSVSLSKAYAGSGQVRQSDAAALSAAVTEAYRQIDAQSSAAGLFLQPCLVRYRLLDASGNEIYSSPRVMAGSPQCCGAVMVNFADTARDTTAPCSLSASAVPLSLVIPAGATGIRAAFAARLEVLATPMLQPCTPGGKPDCRRAVGSGGLSFAVLRLPGSAGGRFSPGSASAPSALLRLVAVDSCERTLAVVDNPFGSDQERVVAVPSSSQGIEAELSVLRAASRARVAAVSPVLAALSAPHKLSASLVATASGATLAAGVTAGRFRGYELPALSLSGYGSEPWRAVVTVVFNDGSRISMPASGTGNAPLTLSPVVTYPSPDVASIAVQLHVQGQPLRVMSLPMAPDASRRCSVYVSSALETPLWREVEGALTVPGDTAAPQAFPSAVAACPQGTLLCCRAVSQFPSPVRALLPQPKALGAWDFGRARFLCGGESGLHSVTVSSDGARMALSLVHQGAILSAGALAAAPGGDVVGIAPPEVFTVRSSTVAHRLAGARPGIVSGDGKDRLVWWAGDAEGDGLRAFCIDHRWYGFSLPAPDITDIVPTASGPLFFTGTAVLGIAPRDLNPDDTAPVAWRRFFPGSWRGRIRVFVPLSARYFDGSLTISHCHLSGDEAVIARYDICGAVHAPLTFIVPVLPCDHLILTLRGSATPDLTLRPPALLPL